MVSSCFIVVGSLPIRFLGSRTFVLGQVLLLMSNLSLLALCVHILGVRVSLSWHNPMLFGPGCR